MYCAMPSSEELKGLAGVSSFIYHGRRQIEKAYETAVICGECIGSNAIIEALNVPITLGAAETLSAHQGESAYSKNRLHCLPTSSGVSLTAPM